LTEITAVVGGGAGGAGGVAGGAPEPDEPFFAEDEPPAGEVDAAANGSLLANREKDVSCPGSAAGTATAISCDESVPGVADVAGAGVAAGAAGAGVPASEGAAAVVVAGAGATDPVCTGLEATAWGFDAAAPPLLSDPIVLTAYAIARTSRTARMITIFFCFAALSFAASAGFFRAMSVSFRRLGSGRDVC
jgi:hypothetical protein